MEENNNNSEKEQKVYSRACTEVLEILKDAPIEDIAKIPKELLEALESKKDKEYVFEADSYMSFENEDISDEARVILMQIFKEYIMKPQEIVQQNEDLNVEEVVEDVEEVKEDNIEENENNEVSLVEVKKESLYVRIIKFFKKIFSFRKNKIESKIEE